MPSLCGQGQGYLFKVVGNYVLKVGGGGCLPAQHSPLQLRNNTSYPGMSDSNFSPCQYSLQPCNIQVDCKRYFPHLVFPAPTKISVTFSVSYATSLFTVKLFMFKKPLGPPPCLRTIKARTWHDLEHGGGGHPHSHYSISTPQRTSYFYHKLDTVQLQGNKTTQHHCH